MQQLPLQVNPSGQVPSVQDNPVAHSSSANPDVPIKTFAPTRRAAPKSIFERFFMIRFLYSVNNGLHVRRNPVDTIVLKLHHLTESLRNR